MIRRLLATAVVATGATLAVPAHPAAAATSAIPLTIPANVAFGLLGHNCSPPQQTVTAQGFDPTTGFPAADVTVLTTCSGSGRDGGGHVTYTASTGAIWDDAGHLYALDALTANPGAGPGFTAYDSYGNEEYQSGSTAYFQWATGFVPVPRVTGLSVTAGSTAGGESETISGSGFTNASSVQFGSTAVPFTVVDDTTITVTTPPDAVTADTPADVTVTSPEGTSATSPADQFTYSLPRVTGLSVSAGPAVGGTSETISGIGFLGATAVDVGSLAAPSFTVVDDTTITVTTPADPIPLGTQTVDVSVTSGAGTGATSPADRYTYVVAPVITSVSPDVGPLTGGTPVTVTGTGLTGVTGVSFGGITVYGSPDSDTSMTVTSPAGESTEAVDLTVTTVGGTSARTPADQFTYRTPIACSKLSGTVGGAITVSGCTPSATGYTRAVLDPAGTQFTWSKRGTSTSVSLGTPTSPGQGVCAKGHIEYDFSGTVTGGTSTYTTIGDTIYGTTCASKSGKLKLLGGSTLSL